MAQMTRIMRSVILAAVLSLLCVSAVAAAGASISSGVASRLSRRVEVLYRDTGNAQQADLTPAAAASADNADPFDSFYGALTDAIIAEVNSHPNATWTAGHNAYFDGKSYDYVKTLCGTKMDDEKLALATAPVSGSAWPWLNTVYQQPSIPRASDLPESFDSRQKWGSCSSIAEIVDQAGCGSCWAVAAAGAMTDRHCIASGGAHRPRLSAINILTCCGLETCGSCEGGYPIHAWQYWVNSGVVSGGNFGCRDTCQPYEWAPCEHYPSDANSTRKCKAQKSTPQCRQSCSNGVSFQSDKSFGKSAYKVDFNEEAIMREIVEHGPVEAGFMVYEDFPTYKSGVYRHLTGKALGGHAIRLIGYGVENGQKYWLAANSWNTDWGNNGLFKIARGTNECFIEDMVFAGRVHA